MKNPPTLLLILGLTFLSGACAGSQPRLIPPPSLEPIVTAPPTDKTQPGDQDAPDAPVVSPGKPGLPVEPRQPWQPQPGDALLERGLAYIESAQLVVLESFPPQFRLALEGSLPSPCHQLRIRINPPDSGRRIQVEVYSLVKPGEVCILVLEPFRASIPLENLKPGRYAVLVNGEKTGEIEVP